jgi:Flp pilus assembly pilin Flp
MHNRLSKLYVMLQNLTNSEQGQDLVEWALLSSLIAVATIAGIHPIAIAVNKAFTNISSSLA